MRILRLWLGVACIGVALTACGMPDDRAAGSAALPTADIVTPPVENIQVIPLTFTPAPQTPASPAAPALPTPTNIVVRVMDAASPGTPTPVPAPPAADPIAALEAELIVEINKIRQANGLPPYAASPELSAAARAHSCDLATHHMISHVSSDGRNLAERLAGGSGAWEWPSESIAAGTDDPATVVAWWMDEPPEGWHRRNILDTQQREVGAGYCYTAEDPSGNHSYWTADFSRRPPSP